VIHHKGHQEHKGRISQGRFSSQRCEIQEDFTFVSFVSFVVRSRFNILRESLREAWFGLYHHRFRAALSMLGISWGIISVVVLLAYGDGFRGALDAGFRGAFSDGTVVVWPGQTSMQAGGGPGGKRGRGPAAGVLAG